MIKIIKYLSFMVKRLVIITKCLVNIAKSFNLTLTTYLINITK